ncbi:unnamed protein product [Soboliphyme baturini]|uniref:Uncharacterized protein n=1 Tax=Soboliphyme baturini TaxID=241478 RepID=A0A183ILJ7_9BILA|nr:unnamed protein product [Soboliphyme baturini]
MSGSQKTLTVRQYKSGRWSTLKNRRRSVKEAPWMEKKRSSSAERPPVPSAQADEEESAMTKHNENEQEKNRFREKKIPGDEHPFHLVVLERGRIKRENEADKSAMDVEETKKLFKFLWTSPDKNETAL